MRLQELREQRVHLGLVEHARRYRACAEGPGHDLQTLAVNAPRTQQYCRNCLTYFSGGSPVDPPDPETLLGLPSDT